MDWHKKAIELYKQGNRIFDIRNELLNEGFSLTYDAVKKTIYRYKKHQAKDESSSEEKEGKTEYKPKYEEQEKGYLIHYGRTGRNNVFITFENLEEAFNLYCIAHLTLNQVSLKMNLTRQEFYAIKTAFDITKDSMPFTPKQIDYYTAEELAEKCRIKKKQYALTKIEENKHKDIEVRIKQMDTTHFWFKEMCTSVNQIVPKAFEIVPTRQNSDRIYVVYNTDVHAGLTVDNYFNTYNIDIMHDRFRKLAQGIIDVVPVGKVYITDLGDTIHGIIHGAVQKYSAWVTNCITEAIRGYENLFITLLDNGYEVYFAKVNGSHESIEKVKDERTEEENFGNLIFEMLQWKYAKFQNLHFIPRLKGLNAAILPIFNYSSLLIHGDNNGLNKLKDSDRLFKEYSITEINAGHIHHRKVEDFNGLNVYYNEPFCGTDQHAGNGLMSSGFGTRIVRYTPEGRAEEQLIRY